MKRKIKIEIVPNGYALDIDGKGYMYFNDQELLMGILVHLGLEQKEPMTNQDMLELLFDAMMSTEYAKKIRSMRSDIQILENEYQTKIGHLDKVMNRIQGYEKIIDGLEGRVSETQVKVQLTEEEYKKSKKIANELMDAVDDLHSKADMLKDEMKEAKALIREINSLMKKQAQAQGTEEGDKKVRKKTPKDCAAAYGRKRLKREESKK